jgi:diguanylate cyclase (GGDEF)-like protein
VIQPDLIRALRPVLPAAVLLIAAVLAAWLSPPLKPSLSGLRTAGPLAALVAATVVSAWFNRGRAFVLAFSMLAAAFALDVAGGKRLYVVIALLVPFNALLALAFAERGARFGRAWPWMALVLAEAALVFFLLKAFPHWSFMDSWVFRSPPTPLLARLIFAGAIAAAVARAWPTFSPVEVGIVGALAAFFIACEWVSAPATVSLFVAAAGLVLFVSVLQESHRMAFRDALTGLPNRRALDEQLRALGEQYSVAMVDVDHFKAFNDAHGHDTGDQVLRLVAARLAEVGGGGRAFRYGGEEFTVLFAGAPLKEALPHLEKVRSAIEHYKMVMRGEDRPKDVEDGKRRRAGRAPDKTLSVTVSIGLAAPGKKHKTPQHVVLAADEALYRAKQAGRNRLSK